MCRVQTEILSLHYSTTKIHSLFGLNQQGEAQPHTLMFYIGAGTKEKVRMVVVSLAYPPSSSGAFLTLEQQETHYHHTFHLSSLLKALVHFQESLCPRVQQQLKAQVGLGNLSVLFRL